MTAKTFICTTCRKEREIDKLATRPGSFDPECRCCAEDRKPEGRYINGIRIWEPQSSEPVAGGGRPRHDRRRNPVSNSSNFPALEILS